MKYSELLSHFISKSELSLSQISDELKRRGFSTDKGYISKLQNGRIPPAGEELTRALADITGGDVEALLLAGHIEKAPAEIKNNLREAAKYNLVFSLIKNLEHFIEFYEDNGFASEDLLDKIYDLGTSLRQDYNHFLKTDHLNKHPESAKDLILQLKYFFYPMSDTVESGAEEIDFRKYTRKQEDPNPSLYYKAHEEGLGDQTQLHDGGGRAFHGGSAALTDEDRRKIDDAVMEARIKQALSGNKLIMNGYVMECTEEEARHLKQQLLMLRALEKNQEK